jgi:predicted DNA-binding transcriptional regulator AlpA
MNLSSQHPEQRFARAKGACQHFQIARSTLWLWVKTRPGFPKPLKASEKVTLFDLRAIEEFLRADAKNGDTNGKPN